ncbi:MAG: CDP-archaeol synthase [Clostridiales Family XIII bacterium]|nr:CDP-archaeol synthase [Clostridiales Family XIII bacterium]
MTASFFGTFTAAILTGALVMALLRTRILAALDRPIDGGALLSDGRPLFGPAKTWRGLALYTLCGAFWGGLWYGLCRVAPAVHAHNLFFERREATPAYGILVGLLLGLAYAVFELPNSFLKRRFGVGASESAAKPVPRALFFLLDQTDSVIGCLLLFQALCARLTAARFFAWLLLGALVHVLVNLALYGLKIRRRAV